MMPVVMRPWLGLRMRCDSNFCDLVFLWGLAGSPVVRGSRATYKQRKYVMGSFHDTMILQVILLFSLVATSSTAPFLILPLKMFR